jgi:hypothetical protein
MSSSCSETPDDTSLATLLVDHPWLLAAPYSTPP